MRYLRWRQKVLHQHGGWRFSIVRSLCSGRQRRMSYWLGRPRIWEIIDADGIFWRQIADAIRFQHLQDLWRFMLLKKIPKWIDSRTGANHDFVPTWVQRNEFRYIVYTDTVCDPNTAISEIVDIVFITIYLYLGIHSHLRTMRSDFTHFVCRQIGSHRFMALRYVVWLKCVHLFVIFN